MGSVGKNYICPHCDAKGKGGYSPDWIGYPVCTVGAANCLDKAIHGLSTRQEVQEAKYEFLMTTEGHLNVDQRSVFRDLNLFSRIIQFM